MSIRGIKNVGIPTVLLHEGEGLALTVETRAGYSYRGVCATTEDNMNISLKDVTATDQHGAVSKLERVFIRGSQVLLVVFPNVFTRAPFFTRVALASQGVSFAGGLGRGRQAAMGVRGACTSGQCARSQATPGARAQASVAHARETPVCVCVCARARVLPPAASAPHSSLPHPPVRDTRPLRSRPVQLRRT